MGISTANYVSMYVKDVGAKCANNTWCNVGGYQIYRPSSSGNVYVKFAVASNIDVYRTTTSGDAFVQTMSVAANTQTTIGYSDSATTIRFVIWD